MQLRPQETPIWLIPLAEEAVSTEEVLLEDEAVRVMEVASGGGCVGKGISAGGKHGSLFFLKKKTKAHSVIHPQQSCYCCTRGAQQSVRPLCPLPLLLPVPITVILVTATGVAVVPVAIVVAVFIRRTYPKKGFFKTVPMGPKLGV